MHNFAHHHASHVHQYSDRQRFAEILGQEILVSEKLRFTILAALSGFVGAATLIAVTLLPDILSNIFMGQLSRTDIVVFMGGLALINLGYRALVGHFIATQHPPPQLARYINAAVEMSIPTLIVIYVARIVGPDVALFTPPVLLYFVFLALSVLRLEPKLVLFASLVGAVEYYVMASLFLSQADAGNLPFALMSPVNHMAKTLLLAITGIVTAIVAWQLRERIFTTFEQLEDRNRIVSVFGQQVSPQVVEKLLAQGAESESETRDVCVMFLDIRGFTHYSEDKSPTHLVDYLNTLFDMTIESINRHDGIINKFLGDGFMAVFGAPIGGENDCANALAAGEEILTRLDAMVSDGALPPTRIGLGLHYGGVVTGNIGSSLRKEYTIIGDVVNLASRIEALNKTYQSQLLISAAVADALDVPPPNAQPLGEVEIRGHEHPVALYQLA